LSKLEKKPKKKDGNEENGDRRSSVPPERKTIGVDTEKLKEFLGKGAIDGIMSVTNQIAGAKAQAVKNELTGQIDAVNTELEGIKTQRRVSRKKLEDAQKGLKAVTEGLTNTREDAGERFDILFELGYDADKAVDEQDRELRMIQRDVEHLDKVVADVDRDTTEQDMDITRLEMHVEVLASEVDGLLKNVKEMLETFSKEVLEELKDVKELGGGLVEEQKEIKKELAEAKEASEKAQLAAEGAEETVRSMEDLAKQYNERHDEISGELETFRTSMIPNGAGVAQEYTAGVDATPPKEAEEPKKEAEESKKKENGNGKKLPEYIRENSETLAGQGETARKLMGDVSTLLAAESLDKLKIREIEKLDISGYEGYDALSKAVKLVLKDVVGQLYEMRHQGALIDAVYDGTLRLIEKKGLEVKMNEPAHGSKVCLEKPLKFKKATDPSDKTKVDAHTAAKETAKGIEIELSKQGNKIKRIKHLLNKLSEAVPEEKPQTKKASKTEIQAAETAKWGKISDALMLPEGTDTEGNAHYVNELVRYEDEYGEKDVLEKLELIVRVGVEGIKKSWEVDDKKATTVVDRATYVLEVMKGDE